MRQNIKNTLVFEEFTEDERKKYFYCAEDKVINNIDTFYYSAFLKNDYNGNSKVNILLEELDALKEKLDSSNEKSFEFKNFSVVRKAFSIYKYCLSVENSFDIFVSNYLPNQNTPRFVIQIRSIALWTQGVEYSILYSFNELAQLLNEYGLEIISTRENRIDYCYHTNSIQNSEGYFSDKSLKKHCISSFKNYMKVGTLSSNAITIDYFSLGSRSSNNIFVRMYNKSREVVEMEYKGMFFEIWYNKNLISKYDMYVYEFCYLQGSFEKIPLGVLKWYIENGKNQERINKCKELFLKYGDNPKKLLSLKNPTPKEENGKIDKRTLFEAWFPQVTLIHNIEFQTKRKFYSRLDKMISVFPILTKNNFETLPLGRLFQIIDNRGIFLKGLTHDAVRFVKDSRVNVNEDKTDYLRWWKSIRSSKVTSFDDTIKLSRDYMKKLNIEKIKKDIITKVSTFSIYNGNDVDNSFHDDLSDFLSYYNDNDMECNRVLFMQENTGEILSLKDEEYYKLKKQQKYKSLKPLLNTDSHNPNINI